MLLNDFLDATDRTAFVELLDARETTLLIKALRYTPFATEDAKVATLEPVALAGLTRFPSSRYVLATGLAALLDCGQVTTVIRTLAEQRQCIQDSEYLMCVLGRALHMRGSRNSRDLAFRLAESMKLRPLSVTELAWLNERLNDQYLHAPGFFEPWPQGARALERPERFDGVLPVPSLPGYSVRMISSKTQIERFANRLRNCLNSMTERILSDHTRVIGIERDGHPHEAIEVNPRGGLVRQWKGVGNRDADVATQAIIEQFLLTIRAIRPRQTGVSRW